MKTSLKLASAIAASLLAASLFAGCGDDGKAASSKAASAAADGKTSVKLVLSSTERPLSWADENGKLQGYEYDIWQEVNKNLKSYSLDIQAVPPETQDVMMESGDAKVASGGYYRTPRREKDYLSRKRLLGAEDTDRRFLCRSLHDQGKRSEVQEPGRCDQRRRQAGTEYTEWRHLQSPHRLERSA